MNIVVLKGNVGHTPKITKFDGGGKVAQFTLATSERGYTTKDGREIAERTTWHNVVVKKTGLAGVVEQFVQKGTPVLIVGKYESRKYTDQNGTERTIYEVNVTDLELCGGQKREDAPAPNPDMPGGYTPDDDLPEGFSL